jgi:hypothetical protein
MMGAHRIIFTGPGLITGTLGTATREECEEAAPHMAREIKSDAGIRYVAWKVVQA